MALKYIYFFGEGKADGNANMKDLLGGKGANLAEMTNLGIPVPPGFTITTQACIEFFKNEGEYPDGMWEELIENLNKLESIMGTKLGDSENPLLVSVRSGAKYSMPGMMDTILNLGLNDNSLKGLIKKTNNERFAYDAYRRFIAMFGSIVMNIDKKRFENILEEKKKEAGIKDDTELLVQDLKDITDKYKMIYKKETGDELPSNPLDQLKLAINAVFNSWWSERAKTYRKLHGISDDLGTAVNVVTMVFGNMGDTSGTGVAFTRNPSTGENKFYGEYLANAQGEDVVAGIRTPLPIEALSKSMPDVYNELINIYKKLENHYKDMLDIEFTVQEGKLYILQTRVGKRTARAALKIAVDMVKEGLIDKKDAILRITPEQVEQLLHPMINPDIKVNKIAKGLPASPGAAVGRVVFTATDAERIASKKEKVILLRLETSPEDIGGMHAAEGILTARGGMTSHAAVVARGMGKPCIVGCGELVINEEEKYFTVNDVKVNEGDYITIDGSTGEVILGAVDLVEPKLTGDFSTLMEWADEFREIGVRANADTPKDAKVAREFGAEGIGLCRTEHMFFGGDRIKAMREMILANDKQGRERALAKILPMQKNDFIEIFKAMEGYPVTIRLLDPPLHEFLPHTDDEIKELSKEMGVSVEELKAKQKALFEFNPMLGYRGCRLGITYSEIYEMQVNAIMEAACKLTKEGIEVIPEIMIPLVAYVNELRVMKEMTIKTADKVMSKYGVKVDYKIGTMIELPRAALTADEIAKEAEFFSFGTNDLTQTTIGLSRDDAGKFLPYYVENRIIDKDPFISIDQSGVGLLIKIGVEKGRKTKQDLKIGICGEHGGDPASIEFCHINGLNYVSCSPYRVLIARLSGAQSNLKKEAVESIDYR
jgi:pyruvate,orthophosphate dikinase